MLLKHLIERLHHVFHAGHVFGPHLLQRTRHLVDHLLHQLLFELLHQLIEALLGLFRLEVIRVEFADLSGEVVRHQIEPHVAFHRRVLRILGAPFVTRAQRIVQCVFDGMTFFINQVIEFVVDLVVDATQVMLVETVLSLLAQLFKQFPQALQLVAIAVAHPVLHHLAQCSVDVAVVQQFVGQLVESSVSIEFETGLRAIPPGVLEP